MSIVGRISAGQAADGTELEFVLVDHDPTSTPTDTALGSTIIRVDTGEHFIKQDNGLSTTVSVASLTPEQGVELETLTDGSNADALHSHFQKYTLFSDQLGVPANASWPVSANAEGTSDSNDPELTVRRFTDAAEEGVHFSIDVPSGATNIVVGLVSRAETLHATLLTVVPKLYAHDIPNNAAVPAFPAATDMTAIEMGTSNEFFQYDSQSITLATLGLTAGELSTVQLTRDGGVGSDDLVGDWTLLAVLVSFT